MRDKVELAGGGTRTEFGPIKLPDGSVIKPFDEVKPDAPELPFRTGYDLESPDFDGAFVRITAYFDKEGKIAAVVGSVLKDGLETAITTKEFKPGALGGLKPGDTRPFDSSGGKNPSAWDPKPPSGSGSGAKGGGTQSTGSAPQNGSGPASNEGRPKPEPAPDDKGEDSPGSDTTKSSSEDSHPEYVFLGQGPKRENEDGSTSQNTLYQRTSDGVYVQTITKTQQDGTQSQEQHCIKDSEEVDCGGMTDEPACGSSCDHLAVFVWLFGCTGAECGTPPVAEPERHCDSSGNNSDTSVSGGGKGQGSTSYSSNVIRAPHCPAGTRSGGPADYGNPYDPNAPDPPDPSQFPDPRDDGVTDPADPGEGENGPAPVAIFEMEEEGPDLGNELLDPVDPWTDDSAPSGDGPPTTGDAERRIP